MLNLRFDRLHRVLCLGAHSDDIEIGAGGTLLRLLHEQPALHVDWVVFSASEERAAEARHSAAQFLARAATARVVVKNFRDSYFPYQGAEIKEFFEELRRDAQPDLIFTHRRDDAHQDHRLLAELTWCAFRDHLVCEYEIPKYEGDLGQPNLFVPLAQNITERKLEIVTSAFASQQGKPWFTRDTFAALMRLRGVECHAAERFAEAFYVRKLTL
ncbi:MAG TPA: PIG-L deacetylase family protein [Pirellulales bacterium]|jgi:LmbE family N-acetylglucosaminyl deacetylase|nr:PIG-L deacetylase family protein [Pirellulales bacterium]